MSEKCCYNKHNNNNSDNPLTSRRSDGGIYNISNILLCCEFHWERRCTIHCVVQYTIILLKAMMQPSFHLR